MEQLTTTVYFAKVNNDAKIPQKRKEDMGFDIYPCFEENYRIIEPHCTELIPTGIASVCSDEYGFILKERGSTGSKGIAQRCGVIDSGYRGQWFVPITNTTNDKIYISKLTKEELMKNHDGTIYPEIKNGYRNVTVYPYEKAICQAILVPVPNTIVKEITYDELQNYSSERGNGALGSSGK